MTGSQIIAILMSVIASIRSTAKNDASSGDWQQWLGEIGDRCTVRHARSGTILEQRANGERSYTWCVCKKTSIPQEQRVPFPSFEEERQVRDPLSDFREYSPYWAQFSDNDCRMVTFRMWLQLSLLLTIILRDQKGKRSIRLTSWQSCK